MLTGKRGEWQVGQMRRAVGKYIWYDAEETKKILREKDIGQPQGKINNPQNLCCFGWRCPEKSGSHFGTLNTVKDMSLEAGRRRS